MALSDAIFFETIDAKDSHGQSPGMFEKRPFHRLRFTPTPRKPSNVPSINKRPCGDPGRALPTDGPGCAVFLNRCLDQTAVPPKYGSTST